MMELEQTKEGQSSAITRTATAALICKQQLGEPVWILTVMQIIAAQQHAAELNCHLCPALFTLLAKLSASRLDTSGNQKLSLLW